MQALIDTLSNCFKNSTSAIAIETFEEERAQKIICEAMSRTNDFMIDRVGKNKYSSILSWDSFYGVTDILEKDKSKAIAKDPIQDIEQVCEHLIYEVIHKTHASDTENYIHNGCIIIMKDVGAFELGDKPAETRALKSLINACKPNSSVIFVGPRFSWPPEIEKLLVQVELELPDEKQIQDTVIKIADNIQKNNKDIELIEKDQLQHIIDASKGLTLHELQRVLSSSATQCKKFDPEIISNEKVSSVKKSGLLEFVQGKATFQDVGGYVLFKEWLLKRKLAFTPEARSFGLKKPKGVVLLGVPGNGKSLAAKCVSFELSLPLLKLDIGKMMGGLVGETEYKTRQTLSLLKSVSPCVVLMDEIEKGLAGADSGRSGDGGTIRRLMGNLLTYMAEQEEGSFFVATCNSLDGLPPEFTRKGRFDELFFFDVPNDEERKTIFKIHLSKVGRDPAKFDLDVLARNTDLFVGVEIEYLIQEALFNALSKKTDITTDIILDAKDFQPQAAIMGDSYKDFKSRAEKKFRKSQISRSIAARRKRRKKMDDDSPPTVIT